MTTCTMISSSGTWEDVQAIARSTIGLPPLEGPPDTLWQHRMLKAEHSPIRLISYTWRWDDLPYWVAMHFRTHKIGCEHFIRSQRTDRTGVDRDGLRQDAPVSHTMTANQQAIISISRRRLCRRASPETRRAWEAVLLLLPKPLAAVCMADCSYRGGVCHEMRTCGQVQEPFLR